MELKETVIKRPVAIGDTVYYVWREFNIHGSPDIYHITKTIVTDMTVNRGVTLFCHGEEREQIYHIHSWDEFYENIFLTRDEAIDAVESEYGYDGRFEYDEG